MFLPKSKYEIKQAPWGMFILSGSEDQGFYVGPYIEDYLGRTFAGTSLQGAEKRVLVPVREEKERKSNQTEKLEIIPTEEDYKAGSIVRYFRQNRTSKVVEEIDEKKAIKSDNWTVISGVWILTGSLEDQKIYGHTYRGVKTRNQKTLDAWEKEIPGITEALNLKPEDLYREV